jgi:uncharacterized protein
MATVASKTSSGMAPVAVNEPELGSRGTKAISHGATRPEADASFGCALAKTPGQIAVCRNEELLKLDHHLSFFYTQAFTHGNASKRELLLNSRDEFVAWREACPTDACIRNMYLARIREVSHIVAGRIKQLPAPEVAASATSRNPRESL